MIIQNVPFFDDNMQKYASCQGPPVVWMALRHFKPELDVSIEELQKAMDYDGCSWVFESNIIHGLNHFGIKARYYCNAPMKKIGNDASAFREISGLDLDNPSDRKEFNIENHDSGIVYLIQTKNFELKKVNIDFIKEQINKNKLVIAVVNRNALTGEKGYKGHFILIKGYEKKGFVCNDAFLGENYFISFGKFKKVFYTSNRADQGAKRSFHEIVVIG